jgi:hypothetical protein
LNTFGPSCVQLFFFFFFVLSCFLELVLFFCITHILLITLEGVIMLQHGVLFCGWMDVVLAIFQCRSLACAREVYVILIMGV